MKEIVYIQAGQFSNYTGTHFWNTQEAYLAKESVDSIYDFDVSFREGLSQTGRPTFCPRLLVFDSKAHFGALSQGNSLFGTNEEDHLDENSPEIWHGNIAEYKQDLISKSTYHVSIDESNDQVDVSVTEDTGISQESVRYWSDFSRVYYIPRTIQKVPDPTDWENLDGNWNLGQTTFSKYNEENGLMEDSFRLFLEECDSPQGIHITNDISTFGGFVHSFLTSFRDQYPKLPCLVVPLLSSASPKVINPNNYMGTRMAINDALYLRSLNEMATTNIPIQPTSFWPAILPSQNHITKLDNIYHASAILSAFLESSTLPLRLKGVHDDLATMAAKLNWRGITPFSELSGIFPFQSAGDFETRLSNISVARVGKGGVKYSQFARLDITRGFLPSGLSAYDKWAAGQSLEDTYFSSVHSSSYPIPTSYPQFFNAVDGTLNSGKGIFAQPRQCTLFSSLATSGRTAVFFSSYATAIKTYLDGRPAVESLGFEREELDDLVNDLWTLHDNFATGDTNYADDGSLGEDEA